jgi:CspA family cold shock protein
LVGVIQVATGSVIQFNEARGFGFIAPDGGGEDVFVHSEELKAAGINVRVGSVLRFDVVEGNRGAKAYNISLADSNVEPVRGVPSSSSHDDDDDGYDIVSIDTYGSEITNILISHCPDATASQIVQVRSRLVALAVERGWIE